MVELGFHVWLQDMVALAAVLGGIVAGAVGLQRNNVALHRAGMIVVAAGFFCNPSQRFWWAVFSKLNFRGPYTSFQQFLEGPTVASVYAALAFNFLAAISLILAGPNLRDSAQEGARIRRLQKKAQ
jgi:hypothetical protein